MLTHGNSIDKKLRYSMIRHIALKGSMGIIRKNTEHGEHGVAVETQFPATNTVCDHSGGIRSAHFQKISMILGVLLAIPDQLFVVIPHFPTVGHEYLPNTYLYLFFHSNIKDIHSKGESVLRST